MAKEKLVAPEWTANNTELLLNIKLLALKPVTVPFKLYVTTLLLELEELELLFELLLALETLALLDEFELLLTLETLTLLEDELETTIELLELLTLLLVLEAELELTELLDALEELLDRLTLDELLTGAGDEVPPPPHAASKEHSAMSDRSL